jgi:hypothetical protein
MKKLADRERELSAIEARERKEQEAITDREDATAAELLKNVNQYLEDKGIRVVKAVPRDKGVRLTRGGDHLEITVQESGGTLQYKLDTGDFGFNTPQDARDKDTMLDAVLAFINGQ